jgi:hypothetical protein
VWGKWLEVFIVVNVGKKKNQVVTMKAVARPAKVSKKKLLGLKGD